MRARRRRSTPSSTSTSRSSDLASRRRRFERRAAAASSRPAPATRRLLRLRRRRPVVGLRRARGERGRHADPGGRLRGRPAAGDGDDISLGSPPASCTSRSPGASSARRCRWRRPATASRVRELVGHRLRAQRRRHLRAGLRQLLHDRRDEQRYPRDVGASTSSAARTHCELFDHFWFNSGYFELNYGPVAGARTGTPSTGPSRRRSRAPTTLVVGTTLRPGDARTAAPCGSFASSATPA